MKNLIYNLSLFIAAFFLSASSMYGQCEEWLAPSPTTGWTDFNSSFGGAPCDDGTGCPFNEITGFQVYAAEAYSVDGFQAGGEYAFSMCNGAGAGSWIPEFTIIAPSGAVDAFGAGDGDGCTITWTASEDGTYLIVINEEGACGGGDNTATDNGFPALTCISGTSCEPAVTACNAGVLTTTDPVSICSVDGTAQVTTTMDTIPTGGGRGWSFSDVLGGTGGIAGGLTLTNAPSDGTYDADLNGVLSFNNLPPLSGAWVIRSVVYTDPTAAGASTCSISADSLIVYFGTESPTVDAVDNGDASATASATGGVTPYTYEWSDGQTTETATDLPNGDYMVTVADANGCSSVAEVSVFLSAVDNVEALTNLSVSPNPSNGLFSIAMDLVHSELIQVEVMDLTGRTVATATETGASARFNFDLSNQPQGVYLLRVTVDNQSLARRLVLTK